MVSIQLKQGFNGGLYYVRNGKKIYGKESESPAYMIRSQVQPTTSLHSFIILHTLHTNSLIILI